VTGAPPRGRHLVRRYGLYSSPGRQRGRSWRHSGCIANGGRRGHGAPGKTAPRAGHCTAHAYGGPEGSARQHNLQQESLGTAACQGVRTGRLGLSQMRKQDGSDRCHSRSRRDRQDHCVSCQARSRANDAVHEDSRVTDGQLGCPCGFWISDSWPGEGKRGGLEDHRGAEAESPASTPSPIPLETTAS
jgi:hypothetical protein